MVCAIARDSLGRRKAGGMFNHDFTFYTRYSGTISAYMQRLPPSFGAPRYASAFRCRSCTSKRAHAKCLRCADTCTLMAASPPQVYHASSVLSKAGFCKRRYHVLQFPVSCCRWVLFRYVYREEQQDLQGSVSADAAWLLGIARVQNNAAAYIDISPSITSTPCMRATAPNSP